MIINFIILLSSYIFGTLLLRNYFLLNREGKEQLKGKAIFFGVIFCFIIVMKQLDALGVGFWTSAWATIILYLLAFTIIKYKVKE